MAARTLAHGSMLAVFQRECAVAIAAEFMKRRFGCLAQVEASAAVAIETAAGAGLVDEIVMAGDAIDGSVMLVRKLHVQYGRQRCRLQQAQSADGGGENHQSYDADPGRENHRKESNSYACRARPRITQQA